MFTDRVDELRLEGGEVLEVGEAPLVGGIRTVLGAGDEEDEDLFLLRPNGWKDLNREFMRSMYGERPREVEREEERERRKGERGRDARGKGSRDS